MWKGRWGGEGREGPKVRWGGWEGNAFSLSLYYDHVQTCNKVRRILSPSSVVLPPGF